MKYTNPNGFCFTRRDKWGAYIVEHNRISKPTPCGRGFYLKTKYYHCVSKVEADEKMFELLVTTSKTKTKTKTK